MSATDASVQPVTSRTSFDYTRAMEYLVQVVQDLSLARDLPRVMQIVRHAARELTGADGATFVLRDGDNCYYADEDAIAPLWKGSRFPMRTCISGWVMINRAPAVIEDIYADPRIPAQAYKPTFVRSLAMVPIRASNPVGAIGNYWANYYRPDPLQLKVLQALADTTSVALETVQVYATLENRVTERTAELERAYHEIRQLSLTDELTGLLNRRGFNILAEQQLRAGRRAHGHVWVLFADVDGLKRVNDDLGHDEGDRLLRTAARALREAFREQDIVARVGGDEFAVFGVSDHAPLDLEARLQSTVDRLNMSTAPRPGLFLSYGVVSNASQGDVALDALLSRADDAMYAMKRRRPVPPLMRAGD